MVTLKELSEIAGVSPATVSRILNNDQSFSVSRQVRLNVLKYASEYGYQTPRGKKKVGKTFVIGVLDWKIVPEGMVPGYDMHFSKSKDNPIDIRFIRLSKGEIKEVDGLVAVGYFTQEEINQLLLCTSNILIVNSDKQLDYKNNRMIIDPNPAWSKAIEYLTAYTNKIAYIGGEYKINDIVIGDLNNKIMRKKLEEKGIYSKNLFFKGYLNDSEGSTLLHAAIHNGAEAIIVSSQLIEKGVIREYDKLGLNIPMVLTHDMPLSMSNGDTRFPVVVTYPDDGWQIAIELILNNARKPKSNINIFISSLFINMVKK
ncbi:MAG: LacI family DNA-binding transcriptional regulator [Spirochaetales bacterium]|nr:LacI family DNA-binding transcriptional regulator [Spirochaetales bacterium]